MLFSNHQPLHAVILLLNNLLSTPSSLFADNIRIVIDVIFALVRENAGFIGNAGDESENKTRVLGRGGSEVWKYLSRLRARAWRKCGWDAGNSLTREQATTLCQTWSRDATQNPTPMVVVQSAVSGGFVSSATASARLAIPMIDFFGGEMLYSEDLDLAGPTSGTELLGDLGENWLDDL